MNNNQPLYQLVAGKLIHALISGNSPFQKDSIVEPDKAFQLAVNPLNGQKYKGLNALWLGMQNFNDPRWLTLRQARSNKWEVRPDAKPTLVNFTRFYELRPKLDASGKKQHDESGKVKMESIQLEKPEIRKDWVFNAQQLIGVPSLEQYRSELPQSNGRIAEDRLNQLLQACQTKIDYSGARSYYDPVKDLLVLPEMPFQSEQQRQAATLHELTHWTGREAGLSRDLSAEPGSPLYAGEELRAAIATLMLGAELGIGYQFGDHGAYVPDWIDMLKAVPLEIKHAATEAQKIVDYLGGLERKMKLDPAVTPELVALSKGDVLLHNQNSYTVQQLLKNQVVKVELTETGQKIKVSPQDGLYKNLLEAKKNFQNGIDSDLPAGIIAVETPEPAFKMKR